MSAPVWWDWCRLCATDSDELYIDLQRLEQSKINALRRFFRVKICSDDNLSTQLCYNCFNYLNELIVFSKRVSKAQSIYEILRLYHKNKTVDVNGLRQHWGLKSYENPAEQGSMNAVAESKDVLTVGETEPEDTYIYSEGESMNHNDSQWSTEDSVIKFSPARTVKSDYNSDCSEDEKCLPPSGAGVMSKKNSLAQQASETDNTNIRITRKKKGRLNKNYGSSDNEDCFTSIIGTSEHFHSQLHDKSMSYTSDGEESETSQKEKSKLVCNKCNKIYNKLSYYKRHISECNGPKKRIHKPGTCHLCNKTLKSKKNLKAHIVAMHTNLREYVCDICGDTFKTSTDLKMHRYVHTEDRPHMCQVCNKGFKNLRQLKVHAQRHGERTYQCDICGEKFHIQPYLHLHKFRHKGHRYQCELCGKKSIRSGAHKTHMLTHIGLKPFFCKYCDKTFTSSKDCSTHKLRLHREEYNQDEDRASSQRHPTPHLKDLIDMIHKMAKNKK